MAGAAMDFNRVFLAFLESLDCGGVSKSGLRR